MWRQAPLSGSGRIRCCSTSSLSPGGVDRGSGPPGGPKGAHLEFACIARRCGVPIVRPYSGDAATAAPGCLFGLRQRGPRRPRRGDGPGRISCGRRVKAMLQPDGPIRGVALAQHATKDGTFSNLELVFTTADQTAVAVIPLGDTAPHDGSLLVAWYRLSGTGERQFLFSATIRVGPGGRAFSQAVAERGLAPGIYEVVAQLGQRQVRSRNVRPSGERDRTSRASPSCRLIRPATVSLSTREEWDLTSEGEAWYTEPRTPDRQPPRPGPCQSDTINASMTPMTDVTASLFFLGQCSARSLSATVAGATRQVASDDAPGDPLSSIYGVVDVCEVPGESDMPGTLVHFVAAGSDSGAAA